MVSFTPYLRNGDPEAVRIHETYSNNNKAFVTAIKQYLNQKQQQQQQQQQQQHKEFNQLPPKEKITIMKRIPSPPKQQQQQQVMQVQDKKNDNILDDIELSSMVKAVTDLIDDEDDVIHDVNIKQRQPEPEPEHKHNGVKVKEKTMQWSPSPSQSTGKTTEQVKDEPKPYQRRQVRNQPGKILANNTGQGKVITLPPRCELTARWSLPLSYLRTLALQNQNETTNITVRDALTTLSVGLYRRGCSDNGVTSSIVSKEVMGAQDSFHFAVDESSDSVWGDVPFYTPRSPGNVVFRLYFENDPVVTLATGPTIIVDVQENDLEPTLRYVYL